MIISLTVKQSKLKKTMKTREQKSNTAEGIKNANGKNFFRKSFILFAILTISSFGYVSKAQNNSIDVDNQSNCNWNVYVYDGANLLTTLNVSPGHPAPYCVSGNVTSIVVQDASATCTGSTFNSPWNYSSNTPTCSFPYCTTGVDCSGGNPTSACPSPVGDFLIVRIF